jgi:AcrR family transcriptional regulator
MSSGKVRAKTPAHEGEGRERIVAVAARLFRTKGFEGTTVRDIAAAAKMQSGSPFYHFSSKLDILEAVMATGLRQGLEAMREALASSDDAVQQFRALVRGHLQTVHGANSDFIPVLLYEWRSLPAAQRRRIIAFKDEYDRGWQGVVDRLVAEGRLSGEPKMARLLILSAINFTVMWFRRGGADTLDTLTDHILGLLLREPAGRRSRSTPKAVLA